MNPKTEKINRTPAEAGLDLPLEDLLWLRTEWLATRSKIDAHTRATYEQKTRYFTEWWTDYGATIEWRLTERHMVNFEAWLLERTSRYTGEPLAYHTRHDALRRTREMFNWAHAQRVIQNIDPAAWVPPATGEAPVRKAATVAQLCQLMDAAATSKYPLRDQAILALFIGTGCRLIEVTNLQVQDIVFSTDGSGTAAIVGKRTKANKSGRRTVGFDPFTGSYLITYLNEMRISEGPLLWISMLGTPLGRGGVYQMVSRSIRVAGLAGSIRGCHDLRRAFATIMSKLHPGDPGWADIVRRQLGHKNYSMTAHYTLLDGDDLRQRVTSPMAPPSQTDGA